MVGHPPQSLVNPLHHPKPLHHPLANLALVSSLEFLPSSEFEKLMFEYLMKQGGPHSRSTTSEPPPPSIAEQTLPHGSVIHTRPHLCHGPTRPTTTYMQLEHQTIFDLEEQYGPSTSSKKGKEKDETKCMR